MTRAGRTERGTGDAARDGACVFLLGVGARDGQVVLARTRRFPGVWQPFGGRLEPGETPVIGALREVREETGIVLLAEELAAVLVVPMDAHGGVLTFFAARTSATVVADRGEIVEHRWFSRAEAAAVPVFPATAAALAALPGGVQ